MLANLCLKKDHMTRPGYEQILSLIIAIIYHLIFLVFALKFIQANFLLKKSQKFNKSFLCL